jgi:membrane protein implicated in regulation of membrane protease activity
VLGYTATTMWWLWVVAAALLLAAEVHTQVFYALFLALGAVVAAVVAALGADLIWQGLAGSAVAVLGVIAVRPSLKQMMDRHTHTFHFPGMPGGLVGQHAVTVDEVGDEQHPGHALLANERWLAATDSPNPLPPQTPVVVTAVRGTTLHVRAASGPHWR